jgi:alpha-L-fucosidase 2
MPAQPDHAESAGDDSGTTTRRNVLRWGGTLGAAAAFTAVGGLRAFAAEGTRGANGADLAHTANGAARPASPDLVPAERATTFWYPAPADETLIIQQGLPVGNGRLGALVGGDPAADFLYLTDHSLWLGDANASLGDDGQFSYDITHFGSFNKLAHIRLSVPAHASATDYRRALDLSNGLVTATYRHAGASHTREVYASHPDDVVVIRLRATAADPLTGSVTVEGTHGETTEGHPADGTAGINGSLVNGLRYAAVVAAQGIGGSVAVSGSDVVFTGCTEVLIIASGGTDYVPDPTVGYFDTSVDPLALATAKAHAALRVGADALLATHVADYRGQYDRMSVDLGPSTSAQRSLDTWSRLTARAADGGTPDPELEAGYLQFGRYLTITGSRGNLPTNLQGLWLETNDPAWFSDYHTDINLEMNYWLADRAGLSDCVEVLADYCLAQLPGWSARTIELYNDPRNGYRNTSGKIDGWAIAFSCNIYGGLGWWWHPAGNAWLCLTLWQHFEYTQDLAFLRRVYPLFDGAARFWRSRLITTTVTDPATGVSREVLVDDHDWSPEQGPQDAIGITYAQELVWMLFDHTSSATELLGVDRQAGAELAALRDRLYLPVVSPTNGWLEEWMSPDNLGEDQHRHLSPLIDFFPGDRINTDDSPAELIDGVRALLTARGMDSFGWACAWRSLCWGRLKEAELAYQLIGENLRPSVDNANGTAPNLFDMYSLGDQVIFQVDANFGTPTAMLDLLLYSRPGVIELLPALPSAWAESGRVTGIGARGGFVVDVSWRAGAVTEAVLRSIGGTRTTVRSGSWSRDVRIAPGESITLRP